MSAISLAIFLAASSFAQPATFPTVTDNRLKLELFAESPQVATPVGIAVQESGRILCIESHTHFPPKDYAGPKTDRIQSYEDTNGDGRAEKITTFFDGLTHTMNLAIYRDGSVFVATRSEIMRLKDTDGDGRADQRTRIAHLETAGNYPHNGLSGFAFDFAGNVYFGFGENLGADYKLIGSDGRSLAGGGEGGNIYCCDADGKNLRRLATGFWNPFHLCFDAFGRLFTVDNDPDSRPPCRLLHIIEGGDYGYRFRNGRRGTHPFTSWNGELPGTLPMVAGTGEAPSGMISYESDNLPEEYRGDLLVTSWGDHRIERYQLTPRGASFVGDRKFVVTGGENFRPVGIALAPDGSLYISDWVDKSYQLHGKGRIWRLSAKQPSKPTRPKETLAALESAHGPLREAAARQLTPSQALKIASGHRDARVRAIAAQASFPNHAQNHELLALLAAQIPEVITRLDGESIKLLLPSLPENIRELTSGPTSDEILAVALRTSPAISRTIQSAAKDAPSKTLRQDPFYVSSFLLDYEKHYIANIAQPLVPPSDPNAIQGSNGIEFALIARRLSDSKKLSDSNISQIVTALLQSSDDTVRRIGIQWVGEQRLSAHRAAVADILATRADTRATFEFCLATLEFLDDVKRKATDEWRGEDYILKVLNDRQTSDSVRELALRVLSPQFAKLTLDRIVELLSSSAAGVRLEAIRTLRERAEPKKSEHLRTIALDEKRALRERLEAIVGLSSQVTEDRAALFQLIRSQNQQVQREALRSLRNSEPNDTEQRSLAAIQNSLPTANAELVRMLGKPSEPNTPPPANQLLRWLEFDKHPGSADEGERIFFHPKLAACFRCHEMNGRGQSIGPALTFAHRSLTPDRLLQSIVYPSHEIAPQFVPWIMETTNGQTMVGLHIGEELDGTQKFVDSSGREFRLKPTEIETRTASPKSIMPEGLTNQLTSQEIRDLITYLLKSPSPSREK